MGDKQNIPCESDEFKADDDVRRQRFWALIETSKNANLPVYVKNILRLSVMDNPLSFQHLSDAKITELECFARNEIRFFLKPTDKKEDFYGPYHDDPSKFKFVMGVKHTLTEMVTFVLDKTDDFWKTDIPANLMKVSERATQSCNQNSHATNPKTSCKNNIDAERKVRFVRIMLVRIMQILFVIIFIFLSFSSLRSDGEKKGEQAGYSRHSRGWRIGGY